MLHGYVEFARYMTDMTSTNGEPCTAYVLTQLAARHAQHAIVHNVRSRTTLATSMRPITRNAGIRVKSEPTKTPAATRSAVVVCIIRCHR